jgi:hypothetical protein
MRYTVSQSKSDSCAWGRIRLQCWSENVRIVSWRAVWQRASKTSRWSRPGTHGTSLHHATRLQQRLWRNERSCLLALGRTTGLPDRSLSLSLSLSLSVCVCVCVCVCVLIPRVAGRRRMGAGACCVARAFSEPTEEARPTSTHRCTAREAGAGEAVAPRNEPGICPAERATARHRSWESCCWRSAARGSARQAAAPRLSSSGCCSGCDAEAPAQTLSRPHDSQGATAPPI